MGNAAEFWYLATPYSKYPDGIEAAFRAACEQSALLVKAGIPIFCPIAHTHPVAIQGGIDPFDHEIWLPADEPFMHLACGLIFCKLPSWEISYGMNEERKVFTAAGKPILDMEPGSVPDALLS
jgi:hypothetical protein